MTIIIEIIVIIEAKEKEDEDNNERVPFLVPLMMVPESEIGVDKKFSFSGDQLTPPNQQQRPNQVQRVPGQRINNRPFNRPNCELFETIDGPYRVCSGGCQ